MSGLIKYDAACRALALAKRVDEAKNIRNRSAALAAYARQVKNRSLEADAWEIRERATERMGELHAEGPKAKGAREPGTKRGTTRGEKSPTSLRKQGIDKDLAKEMRRAVRLKEAGKFEAFITIGRRVIEDGRVKVKAAITTAEKQARRAERERHLAAKIVALPEKRYGIIVADPEWRYKPWSSGTGLDRAADNHYPTSTLEALMARDVGSIAARDSILFMWATVPMLPEAFCVLDAWGFAAFVRDEATGFLKPDRSRARYVSSAAWWKHSQSGIGTGHWFRVDHEILLVATRGSPPAPAKGTQERSVFDIPASRVHSQKPDLPLIMIERLWPNLPKIELNRRGPPRSHWDAWGQEVEDPR